MRFLRSRFVSWSQCGDDRFRFTHLSSGATALVSELVVRLWLQTDDETPQSSDNIYNCFGRGYASITGEVVNDATRHTLRATFEQLVELGALESATTERGYDLVADDYDARKTPLEPVIGRLIEHTAPHHRSGVVLEVGCGTGQVLERLAEFEPSQLHGIEPSRPMLLIAREKLAEARCALRIQQGAAERLPFQDRSIDLLVVATALHWFDQRTFWREVERVVSSDHRIVVWNSVLAPGDNVLTEYFGQGMAKTDRDALLRADSRLLVSELPPSIGLRHFERFEIRERYESHGQLEKVARSWCPRSEFEPETPPSIGPEMTWPLEVPYRMSFAVLEALR